MFMVPLDVFSLLAMRRVTGELRTSTGDAAMDKARRRIVDRDDRPVLEHEDNTRFRGPLYVLCGEP